MQLVSTLPNQNLVNQQKMIQKQLENKKEVYFKDPEFVKYHTGSKSSRKAATSFGDRPYNLTQTCNSHQFHSYSVLEEIQPKSPCIAWP